MWHVTHLVFLIKLLVVFPRDVIDAPAKTKKGLKTKLFISAVTDIFHGDLTLVLLSRCNTQGLRYYT